MLAIAARKVKTWMMMGSGIAILATMICVLTVPNEVIKVCLYTMNEYL